MNFLNINQINQIINEKETLEKQTKQNSFATKGKIARKKIGFN